MFHRQHKFRQQVSGMLTDNGDAEDFVLSGNRKYFDETDCGAVSNGSIKIIQAITSQLISDALLLCLLFVDTYPRYFRFNKGGPGDHPIIDAEFFELSKQRVDGGIPGLMSSGVGKLVWPGYISGGVDIWIQRFEIIVGEYGSVGFDTQFFKAVAIKPSRTAYRADQ